jgi:glycosyltransferase involved in cell wall biosynthesis
LEIIVSDNASTDDTSEVARSCGGRVRYHRNPQNIGAPSNFSRVTELATGEFFSWLQDDDVIHRDFVRRATEALTLSDEIVFYASYAIYSASPESIKRWDTIHGPLIPVNWMASEPRVIDGLMAVPLCLFQNIAISPAIAFRTSAIRRAVRHLLPACPLFAENIITAEILREGKAMIDPWIGAIHISHADQANIQLGKDPDEVFRQFLLFQKYFETFMTTLPPRWRDAFTECIDEIPVEHRVDLIERIVAQDKCPEYWASAPSIVLELRDMVIADLPSEALKRLSWRFPRSGVKRRIKQWMPPRLWNAGRLVGRALRHGVEVRVR